MTKFFIKLNKPLFLAYLHDFFNNRLRHAELHNGFWRHAKILKHLMIQFQENTQADGRKDKRTEGQTDPTLKDPSGYQQGSKKYNCSRLALKVKGTEKDVGLTKNYCITTSMQKISSIHKLILKKL